MLFMPVLIATLLQTPVPTPDPEKEPFQTLETRVSEAIKTKDVAALDGLLAKDFTFNAFLENQAPQVLNRSEWLKTTAHYTLIGFALQHVAGRVFGNVAVVRLQPVRSATLGTSVDRSGEFAVVDIWTKDDGAWRLSARYLSRPDILKR